MQFRDEAFLSSLFLGNKITKNFATQLARFFGLDKRYKKNYTTVNNYFKQQIESGDVLFARTSAWGGMG